MKTLAQKVDWLFDIRRGAQGRPYTYGQVQRATGNRITASYVWKLRTGAMSNPGLSALEALAGFFQAPLDYFASGGEYLEDSIKSAQALPEGATAREDALRWVNDKAKNLSDESLRSVMHLIEYRKAHES